MSLALEPIRSETEDAQSSTIHFRILYYPADYTLEVLHTKNQRSELIIPHFQRQFVWTHLQASKLIESFLMGLPVPGIFLYKEAPERFLIVDGQQRLLTIFSYFDGRLPSGQVFSLKGVNQVWEGKLYRDLAPPDQSRLRDSILRAVIMEQIHPSDITSVYHVFERLNTGGTSLKPQEVRNCVYHGEFNNFLIELNRDPGWRAIIGSPNPDKRMRDVELLLRFFALGERHQRYKKSMKDFLSAFMKEQQMSADNVRFKQIFRRTVDLVKDALGVNPFRIRAGLNAAIFDSVMVAFALCDTVPQDIQDRYRALLRNKAYVTAVTAHTTDEETVSSRLKIARESLFGSP